MGWLEDFRAATAEVITEPWWRCLAEAIATVESDHGRAAITGPVEPGVTGINEIGYKAVAGHPAAAHPTQEADTAGQLQPCQAEFRLFADRAEQARALLWLLRTSAYYEAARLLFILAFYAAYAPGRVDGARALVQVFNAIARSGAHEGVRPLAMVHNSSASEGDARALAADRQVLALNHAAARQAVLLFAELTADVSPNPAAAKE